MPRGLEINPSIQLPFVSGNTSMESLYEQLALLNGLGMGNADPALPPCSVVKQSLALKGIRFFQIAEQRTQCLGRKHVAYI